MSIDALLGGQNLLPHVAEEARRRHMIEANHIDTKRPIFVGKDGQVSTVVTGTHDAPGGGFLNVPSIDTARGMSLANPVAEGIASGDAQWFATLQEAIFDAILKSTATGIARKGSIDAARKKTGK